MILGIKFIESIIDERILYVRKRNNKIKYREVDVELNYA